MSETATAPVASAEDEARITALVRRFYELSLADAVLGPLFAAAIADFDDHYRIVADFWSHALLGTSRYQRGTPYSHHVGMVVTEDHFTRWMAAFAQAVGETLTFPLDALALKRAEHMTQSFKMGLLPLPKPGRVTYQ